MPLHVGIFIIEYMTHHTHCAHIVPSCFFFPFSYQLIFFSFVSSRIFEIVGCFFLEIKRYWHYVWWRRKTVHCAVCILDHTYPSTCIDLLWKDHFFWVFLRKMKYSVSQHWRKKHKFILSNFFLFGTNCSTYWLDRS